MSSNPARPVKTANQKRRSGLGGRRHRRQPEIFLRQELVADEAESLNDEQPLRTSGDQVAKSIEEVFQSKGRARKRRQPEPLRPVSYESETR